MEIDSTYIFVAKSKEPVTFRAEYIETVPKELRPPGDEKYSWLVTMIKERGGSEFGCIINIDSISSEKVSEIKEVKLDLKGVASITSIPRKMFNASEIDAFYYRGNLAIVDALEFVKQWLQTLK